MDKNPPHPARRAPEPAPALAPPSDRGIQARDRLLKAALRVFAEKGFAEASTREIAAAAGMNVASIHYYFGDKTGLYRAALTKPITDVTSGMPRAAHQDMPLEQFMGQFFRAFLAPLVSGDDQHAHAMRLHLRELVEPTPVLREVFEQNILPHHLALIGLLGHHCGAKAPDAELHQLAFAIVAMVNDYWLSRGCMQMLAPELMDAPDALDRTVETLTGYACALVEHERFRRRALKGRRAE